MTNLTINNKARTIEMTKKFEKAASRFGSDEYKMLQEARKDYPAYKVVVKASTVKGKESFKGLTYEYMEKYIAAHDDEDKAIMAEYKMLRGTSAEGMEMNAAARSYGEMKKWFFDKYPAFKEFTKSCEKVLKKEKVA